ncbi:MAG: lipopolysaccharide transport periplasmic protein LptA [Gammaproteobacteria bacterium]|nr:lipopolysaccharide transport periplasmic protein LptA [Gammaproteobacteria bacterium]
MKTYLYAVLSLFLGLAMSLNVIALDSDKDQPIEVEADTLEIRDDENISVYSGNVSLVQGSMQIRSDDLVIHFNDNNEIQLMEMTGKPATFRQLNNNGKEMRGEADRLDYREPESSLVFSGNARFDNNGDTIEGSSIRINTANDTIEANSATNGDRVRVVIQPKSKKKNQ